MAAELAPQNVEAPSNRAAMGRFCSASILPAVAGTAALQRPQRSKLRFSESRLANVKERRFSAAQAPRKSGFRPGESTPAILDAPSLPIGTLFSPPGLKAFFSRSDAALNGRSFTGGPVVLVFFRQKRRTKTERTRVPALHKPSGTI